MSTILHYPCGCQWFSDSTSFDCLHLCTEHKIQVGSDALNVFIQKNKTPHQSVQKEGM